MENIRDQIVRYLSEHQGIGAEDLFMAIGVSYSQNLSSLAISYLSNMVKMGVVIQGATGSLYLVKNI